MSCISGIVNFDGAPVDRDLMALMTSAMRERAPDKIGIWCSGNVGLGHAMLRVSPESENEHQPLTLDGRVWITADARIDGRADLIRKLRSAGSQIKNDTPDVELILNAYAAFGESFLDHLIGDFALALWDSRSKKLICARDHFGVRPFFYAKTDRIFIFASDIDALLTHPLISSVLDDEAVADFLTLGSFWNAESSIYRDIRCLPPASYLQMSTQGSCVRKYWELPVDIDIRYRKQSEYIEHFLDVFGQAVNDRLRADHVALELSGGMDSTAIAAIAAADASAKARVLSAYTTTCHGLLPDDQEGHYAGIVATHLSIPINYQASEDYAFFERHSDPALRTMQPVLHSSLAARKDTFDQIRRTGTRVLLSGFGGDAVLAGSSTRFRDLLLRGRIIKFLVEAGRHIGGAGTVRGMGLRSAFVSKKSRISRQPSLPNWIDPDFAKRVHLEDRWKTGCNRMYGESMDACSQLSQPWLGHAFSSQEMLRVPLEIRYPFFDVRLILFLLGLPNFMKYGKKIMREAMRGKLPEPIRTRPKTALAGDLIKAKLSREPANILIKTGVGPLCKPYVDREQHLHGMERYIGEDEADSIWPGLFVTTPIALNNWLIQNENR